MEKEIISSLVKLYDRDLNRLYKEIQSFEDEKFLWTISGDIKNPAGNLCLHLCGNLRSYIGQILGGSEYIRNREHEFVAKHISKNELLEQVLATKEEVLSTLPKLNHSQFMQEYPVKVFDYNMTTLYFLVHLQGHLNYHLGQINYIRRMAL